MQPPVPWNTPLVTNCSGSSVILSVSGTASHGSREVFCKKHRMYGVLGVSCPCFTDPDRNPIPVVIQPDKEGREIRMYNNDIYLVQSDGMALSVHDLFDELEQLKKDVAELKKDK